MNVQPSQSSASITLLTDVTGPHGVAMPTVRPSRPLGRQPVKTYTRPILRCTTGWRARNHGQIRKQQVIIAIEPNNTCMGSIQ